MNVPLSHSGGGGQDEQRQYSMNCRRTPRPGLQRGGRPRSGLSIQSRGTFVALTTATTAGLGSSLARSGLWVWWWVQADTAARLGKCHKTGRVTVQEDVGSPLHQYRRAALDACSHRERSVPTLSRQVDAPTLNDRYNALHRPLVRLDVWNSRRRRGELVKLAVGPKTRRWMGRVSGARNCSKARL
jgi:hypothetical protein